MAHEYITDELPDLSGQIRSIKLHVEQHQISGFFQCPVPCREAEQFLPLCRLQLWPRYHFINVRLSRFCELTLSDVDCAD